MLANLDLWSFKLNAAEMLQVKAVPSACVLVSPLYRNRM